MARTETVLRVFVASPGDVAEERAALEGVIQELNITRNGPSGVYLELVKWETHMYPGIGTDSQAVINEQIDDDYDIFMGLMWVRFGTATERAGSGTAEEFYRAYRKHRDNPSQIRVMFYFRNTAVAPSDLDLDQLASVRAFQKELGEKGTYYWTYTNRDEFAQLARIHLSRQLQEWGKRWGSGPAQGVAPAVSQDRSVGAEQTNVGDDVVSDEEEGYLDLLVSGQDNLESVNDAMTRITNALSDLGTRISERTEELNRARTPAGDVDLKQAKRISNRVAEEVNNFAALMEVEVPVFGSSFSNAIEAYTRAVSITKDLDVEKREDVERVKEVIKIFQSTLSSSQRQMTAFRDTIANTPRATTTLNRARKRTLSILDRLDEEFATASNLTSEIEKVFDEVITD